jgi:hypothetical protein
MKKIALVAFVLLLPMLSFGQPVQLTVFYKQKPVMHETQRASLRSKACSYSYVPRSPAKWGLRLPPSPFEPEQLLAGVRRALESHRLKLENRDYKARLEKLARISGERRSASDLQGR